jgi:hypothetical protein
MDVKKTLKICLISCLLLILVPTVLAFIAGAIFLHRLEFGPMEPMQVVDTHTGAPQAAAPRDTIRVAAEWEPALGALVRWPLMVPESLVVEIARDDTLFLLVEDEKSKAGAEEKLVEWGIRGLATGARLRGSPKRRDTVSSIPGSTITRCQGRGARVASTLSDGCYSGISRAMIWRPRSSQMRLASPTPAFPLP